MKYRLSGVLAFLFLCGTTHTADTAAAVAAGALDPTFGIGGTVTTDFTGATDVAFAVALQTDGKIVAAGVTHDGLNNIALARYNSDGTLDASFGTGGQVTANFAGVGAVAFSVAAQPDDHRVAFGADLVTRLGREVAALELVLTVKSGAAIFAVGAHSFAKHPHIELNLPLDAVDRECAD